jgi:hypothetical protein
MFQKKKQALKKMRVCFFVEIRQRGQPVAAGFLS